MKKLFLLIAIAILATACSNNKECTALSFLNASMPYGDAIDYSEDYFLKNIQTSFKAKKELPWGKRVPEREFKHFVLPIRVNNENLDNFRTVYYDELRDRVKVPIPEPVPRWRPSKPRGDVVARSRRCWFQPYAPYASQPARSTSRVGHTATTITLGLSLGSTANGISWVPVSLNRCSI